MDLSAIIVVVVLTGLSLAALVGLEIYSRRAHRERAAEGEDDLERDYERSPRTSSKRAMKQGANS